MTPSRATARVLALLAPLALAAAATAASPGSITDARPGWPQVTGGPGGNPVAPGAGDLTRAGAVRDRFRGAPRHLVAGDLTGDGRDDLAVLFDDGSLEVNALEGGRLRRAASWSGISPEAPPVVAAGAVGGGEGGGLLCVDDRGDLALYTVEGGEGRTLADGLSALTAPAIADLDRDGRAEIVAVGDRGALVVIDSQGQTFSSRDAELLPDARIVVGDLNGDGKDEAVALSRPLSKVKGARLGDDLEAQGLAVFSWSPGSSPRLEDEFRLDGRRHFDALFPLLADIDRTGRLAAAVAVTDEEKGSAVWTFAYSGRSLRKSAEGPKTKEKQHYEVVAAATLGGSDRPALFAAAGAGGEWTLEALRPDLANTRLGSADGVLLRPAGSRVGPVALVGAFGPGGRRELLAPAKDGSSLRLFSFNGSLLQSREAYSAGKAISSNLCPGDFDGDGKADVAFGAEDGSLVILTGR